MNLKKINILSKYRIEIEIDEYETLEIVSDQYGIHSFYMNGIQKHFDEDIQFKISSFILREKISSLALHISLMYFFFSSSAFSI